MDTLTMLWEISSQVDINQIRLQCYLEYMVMFYLEDSFYKFWLDQIRNLTKTTLGLTCKAKSYICVWNGGGNWKRRIPTSCRFERETNINCPIIYWTCIMRLSNY